MRLSTPKTLLAGALVLSAALGLAAMAPTPALAQSDAASSFDVDKMSDADRAAFRAAVRRALLDDPEMIADALRELERRRAEAALGQVDDAIADGAYIVSYQPEDADLTLIELTDYNCPYCRRAQPEIADFLAKDKKVAHIVLALPYIGPELPERMALAAREQADAETIAKLHADLMVYDGQMDEMALEGIAEAHGLDWDRLVADMTSEKVESEINRVVDAAQALRINGTPAFILDGEVHGGLLTAAQLGQLAQMARAAQAKN